MNSINLIPTPTSLTLAGGTFPLTATTTLTFDSPAARAVAELFAEQFYRTFGLQLPIGSATKNAIAFQTVAGTETPEAYALQITPSSVTIQASAAGGLFYGSQSLLQLFDAETVSLPALAIQDSPRFGWRGLMLDSARFFHPVSWVKKWIDLLALHKYNVFHWHLTEDQGWRVDIFVPSLWGEFKVHLQPVSELVEMIGVQWLEVAQADIVADRFIV